MLIKLAKILAPPHCVGCGKEGDILCPGCQHIVVKDTIKAEKHNVTAAIHFEPIGKKLIHVYKFQRQRDASHIIARLMAQSLPRHSFSVVTAVPTAPIRVRQRGFDHTALLARRVAASLKLPYRPLLFRRSSVRQVGQNRAARLQQAADLYGAHPSAKGRCILLIDDVITTGATVEACMLQLRHAGATSVFTSVLALQLQAPSSLPDHNDRHPKDYIPEKEI